MSMEMRTFGYLCPRCGKTVLGTRDSFAVSAAGVSVPCDCGGSALKASYDGIRCRMEVPCGLCGETHSAVCPPDRLLHGSTALACPQSGKFVCFIGPEGTVEKQLRELSAIAEKEKASDGGAFLDEVIMYEILSELKEIAARPGGISCHCGSARYGMEIRRSYVDLICRACGSRLRLPAATEQDLEDLCCHMKLVIPGK